MPCTHWLRRDDEAKISPHSSAVAPSLRSSPHASLKWLGSSDRRSDLGELGRLFQPSPSPLRDAGIEKRLHVLLVEGLAGVFCKACRNCCQIEIGTIAL